MLVLKLFKNNVIQIGDTLVTVHRIHPNACHIAIDAPKEVKIGRVKTGHGHTSRDRVDMVRAEQARGNVK